MPGLFERVVASLVLLGSGAIGCRAQAEADPPLPRRVTPAAIDAPEYPELPPRWTINGGTVADQPALPEPLAARLRAAGYEAAAVQDHILVDLNGDGRRDAVVLLVSLDAPGGFEAVALLSEGEAVELRSIAEIIAHNEAGSAAGSWPIYALSVVPLVDGPTLIAAAPRPGSCERGPIWSFIRVTGTLLEPVGRLAIEPYDCAAAVGEIEFERGPAGEVTSVVVRHGDARREHSWDAVNGSFVIRE